MKTMTTREIAEVFGMDVSSINKNVKELFPGLVKNGVATRLNELQVAQLATKLRVNEATSRPDTSLGDRRPGNIAHTDAELMLTALAGFEAMQMLYKSALDRCDALQLELDKSKEYVTVKRMQSLNDCSFDWRALKDYSIENGYEIKKVFDQNYGEVNAYHKDVWLAVYGEQCDEVPWND